MNLSNYLSNFIINEHKVVYLIFFLPIFLFIGSTVANLSIFLIISIFIFEIINKKKIYILNNKDFLIFIIFYIYIIFNSLLLTQTSEGLTRALGFIRFPFLALAIGYYFSIEDGKYEKKILNFWFITFLVVTIDILFEFFIGFNLIGIKSTYPGRVVSFTGDELKIGGYYFGFILLAILYVKENLKKYVYFFIIFFLITSLLIGERANFFKVFFMISILLIFLDKKSLIKKISLVAGLIIFTFLIIKAVPGHNSRFINQIFQNIHKNDIKNLASSNLHISHYYTAIQVFKKNIFFGVGVKNFRNVSYEKKYNPIENVNGGANHPHQFHFELLSELGLIGYVLLLGILIYFIKMGIKIYFKSKNFLYLSSSIFILATILPLIPSGSFFTTYTATIFWVNFAFLFRKNI